MAISRMTTVYESLCLSKKKSGEPCRAKALTDGIVSLHSPAMGVERREPGPEVGTTGLENSNLKTQFSKTQFKIKYGNKFYF
jgi:hypothetical protein